MSTASREAYEALQATTSLLYNGYSVTRDWKVINAPGTQQFGTGDYIIYNPANPQQAVLVSGSEYGGRLGTFVTKQGSLSDFGNQTPDQIRSYALSPQDYAVKQASLSGVQGDDLN